MSRGDYPTLNADNGGSSPNSALSDEFAGYLNGNTDPVTSNYWFSLIIAAISLGIFVNAISGPEPPVNHLTNVRVLEKLGPSIFRMDVYDPATRIRNKFVVDFCGDSDPSPEIKPGATLTLLQYWEDRHDHCFDVSGRNHTGYTLLRNLRGEPIYDAGISSAGSTTAHPD